jgi:hypothetical protein
LKRLLLIIYLFIPLIYTSYGQVHTVFNIVEATNVSKQKFESYVSKKGFAYLGSSYQTDTIAKDYNFREQVKKKKNDSIPVIPAIPVKRAVTIFNTKEDFCFTYRTTSPEEFKKIKSDIKGEGFFSYEEIDSGSTSPHLYQSKDLTINISSKQIDDSLTEYSFLVRKQIFLKPKEIIFAEDMFVFNSHEYLSYYFGEKNVKKDIYYLSEKKIGKCSILFPNTNRQIVFIWGDEVNNCKLVKMYVGGQLMAESSLGYNQTVAENIWQLKSGVAPGMSLYQLRKLNDAAFNFHGGNSANTGLVLEENNGKVDFKNENIILGCMNCNDVAFYKKTIINSDDAIEEERILFVLTIVIDPVKIKEQEKLVLQNKKS